ncbi:MULTISPECIES: DUF1048 domain-containing protein [Streptomyces]|uniref:DUF1048 domain-containing protein n=1 Tax=Streptomyces tsukubensis (strain DSM 42081 / NBRC 108919 / NRRL 18488 / 9993) TaxID=1114943 RepID=I2NBZ9_STRT9|nr:MULTISPECIES: DUF1048 domain-containing protein [Streptomyces]AZK92465.1 hypothetical protein B7R87_00065 [Streptomyces tsukubensis]EIF94546.1 hypothetical protein [Streptomyces tsukubensis NRRL18488]MYS67113.1 DUF1048 domain-containing protein [Streptomyces sp. SID5473]QKM65844.1 DUF1048 domain-containing protein [Streptomyces tsukubensis NRRL18488]TAI40875.1 DUF1048 domain-containing protein [Streptomyces tsukubensis]
MSDTETGGFMAKVIGPKKRWRAYRARIGELPAGHRAAAEAVERYLMHFVPVDADSNASMFEDLADLFEQAAADGIPVGAVVGEDPVEFAEAFARNYTEGGYVPGRARKRLAGDIADAGGKGR